LCGLHKRMAISHPLSAAVIDVEVSRFTIAQVLRKAGFQVVEALGSGAGVRAILEGKPSLVIVGEEIGPFDGVALLPFLRRLTEAPIIALGSGGGTAMAQAIFQGADFYLTRPLNLSEFMARVRALLRRSAPGFGHCGALW
jgi:DNA-binding response OmpR family regulator